MSYLYQGDYYLGSGDPGLFSFIGKAIGGVARTVGGLVPGPVGTVLSAAGRVISPQASGGGAGVKYSPLSIAGGGVPRINPPFGGATGVGVGPVSIGEAPGSAAARAGAGAPSGYHYNKAYSYKYNAAPGTYLVKNRSRNAANPRALRRALRRTSAFVGLAKRALKGSGYTVKRTGTGATRRRRR